MGLVAAAALGLVATRSLRPLAGLFTSGWSDGTFLSFPLYGVLPFLMWAVFDEGHNPYPVPFRVVTSLCLAGGAVSHLRSGTAARRLMSLLAGLTVSWCVTTVALTACWTGRKESWMSNPAVFWDTALPMAIAWLVVCAALLVPWILGLVRSALSRLRSA